MRTNDDGADGIDDAADGMDDPGTLLPPPRELAVDPEDKLWHTASFAAITDEPPSVRRRKLTVGLAFLGAATTAVCAYAAVELTGIAGLTPPSPPRYVINDQANAQQGQEILPAPPAEAAPLPAAPRPTPTNTRPPSAQALGSQRNHDDRQDDRSGSQGKDKSAHRKHKSKSDD